MEARAIAWASPSRSALGPADSVAAHGLTDQPRRVRRLRCFFAALASGVVGVDEVQVLVVDEAVGDDRGQEFASHGVEDAEDPAHQNGPDGPGQVRPPGADVHEAKGEARQGQAHGRLHRPPEEHLLGDSRGEREDRDLGSCEPSEQTPKLPVELPSPGDPANEDPRAPDHQEGDEHSREEGQAGRCREGEPPPRGRVMIEVDVAAEDAPGEGARREDTIKAQREGDSAVRHGAQRSNSRPGEGQTPPWW